MMHPDRKPGVKLVTDPPQRESMLTLRLPEAVWDDILETLDDIEREWSCLACAAELREVLDRARDNRGRMNL